MKQLKKTVGLCLLILSFTIFGSIHAEYIHAHSDYTTPGVYDGDLIIVDGNLSLKHTLTVNGDLKIISGKVLVQSDNFLSTTVDLYVFGDLIVTNTETSGEQDATIEVNTGKLVVKGEIFTRSDDEQAFVIGKYGISAGKISTDGSYGAFVLSSKGSIVVEGGIFTKSEYDGRVSAFHDIEAASISTISVSTYTVPGVSAYVSAGRSIVVSAGIVTKSKTGAAYVKAATSFDGGIRADYVFTNGYYGGYIESGVQESTYGYINVAGDIVTNSAEGGAFVEVNGRHLTAGNISTYSENGEAFVKADRQITVDGDMMTRADDADSSAYVKSSSSGIKAKSINTYAGDNAYVWASGTIDVEEAIVTRSFGALKAKIVKDKDSRVSRGLGNNDADVYSDSGDIKAGSIKTEAIVGSADVSSDSGYIDVKETINTKSSGYDAEVLADGFIRAENIYTDGYFGGRVLSFSSNIEVKDVIKTKSADDNAYVSASGNVSARAIRTEAEYDAYLSSDVGSIFVEEDIYTKSVDGDADIGAPNGDIIAQKVKVKAGDERSILAGSNSGHFQLILDQLNQDLKIQNCEFDLDSDRVLNVVLTLLGTCTVNGKGHKIELGPNGGIVIGDGVTDSSALLNNIEISKVGDEKVKCYDSNDVLEMNNAILHQSSNVDFKNGAIKVFGDSLILGPGRKFSYESSQASTIHKNATLTFGPRVVVDYKSSGVGGFSMIDKTSRLNFNDATLNAVESVTFKTGKLVFDNDTTFNASSGKTVTFGDGVFANNVDFEYHVDANLDIAGDGSFVNLNV